MPRPKAFDPDDALERAMELFWERGYGETAMSDLVERLGVSRQSLYDTFGDKRAIYLAALRRFRERPSVSFRQMLAGDEPVRLALRRVFDAVVADECGGCGRGCMFVNAAIAGPPGDPEVERLLADNACEVEAAFTARLRRAQERGEIGAHHDPVALGRFYAAVLSGLRIAAKVRRDPVALADVVRVAVAALG